MRRLTLLLFIILLGAFCAAAQFTVYDEATLKKGEFIFAAVYRNGSVQNEKLTSKLMGRDLPYRIILPQDTRRQTHLNGFLLSIFFTDLPVISTTGQIRRGSLNLPKVQISSSSHRKARTAGTPTARAKADDKYESYISQGVDPEIDKKFRRSQIAIIE
jgi:hypothetical protein